MLLRIRSLHAFGVRRVSWRWLLIGVGAGVVAIVVKGFAVMAYTALTGDSSTLQEVFGEGGSGSVWPGVIAHVINNLPTVFVLVLNRAA